MTGLYVAKSSRDRSLVLLCRTLCRDLRAMTLAADDLARLKAAPADRVKTILVELFGPPTAKRTHEWRFGTHGSKSFDFRKMAFFDFESRCGGSILDAVRSGLSCSMPQAIAWAEQRIGVFAEAQRPSTSRRLPDVDVEPKKPDQGLVRQVAHWMNVWNEADAISGTLGEVYLVKRGLWLPDGAEMRFHPECPRGFVVQPAVVMLMRDIVTNEPRAIQRRFLLADGTKDGPTLSLGPTSGTAWKLTPDEDVVLGLGIAEGHADALAALNDGFVPMWATGGTGGMATFPLLGGVGALTIFRDHGDPGLKAARQCQARWRDAGREAVIVPPSRGGDFAEQIESRR